MMMMKYTYIRALHTRPTRVNYNIYVSIQG